VDNAYAFSEFDSLISVVADKSTHYLPEIIEANKEKHKALLRSMYREIEKVNSDRSSSIKSLEKTISEFQQNIRGDFATSGQRISGLAEEHYASLFSKIEEKSMYAISNDVGDKEMYCKRACKNIMDETACLLKKDISAEINSLKKTIEERKRTLDQQISDFFISDIGSSLSMTPEFGGSFDKLDFSFGDFGHIILSGLGAVGTYFALANFWNPLGWIAGALALILGLAGGRDKEAEAKAEMRENIRKAKIENKPRFNLQISKIKQELNSNCRNIVRTFDSDKHNLVRLKDNIQSIEQNIKLEYSRIKNSEYGTI